MALNHNVKASVTDVVIAAATILLVNRGQSGRA